MPLKLIGLDKFFSKIQKAWQKLFVYANREVKAAAITLQVNLNNRTPVWQGDVISSYRWQKGESPSQESPIKNFGDQEPGTNKMPLPDGEDNRPLAEQRSMALLKGVLASMPKDKLVSLTVTNKSDIWDLIDSGSAPTKDRARNPGGVSRIALQMTRAKHVNFKIS